MDNLLSIGYVHHSPEHTITSFICSTIYSGWSKFPGSKGWHFNQYCVDSTRYSVTGKWYTLHIYADTVSNRVWNIFFFFIIFLHFTLHWKIFFFFFYQFIERNDFLSMFKWIMRRMDSYGWFFHHPLSSHQESLFWNESHKIELSFN